MLEETFNYSLKDDASHELEEVTVLLKKSIAKSRLAYGVIVILITGLCSLVWLKLFSLSVGYFLAISIVCFFIGLTIQLRYFKQALFWKDKTHYLNRYLNNLVLNSDIKYSPFSVHELTHEPLLANSTIKRCLQNYAFLTFNIAILLMISYTAYQF